MSATTDEGGFLLLECKVNRCSNKVFNRGLCSDCWKKDFKERNNKKLTSIKISPPKPLHTTWQGMINRCNNPNATGYKYYGGRGITVCDRWLNSYKAFEKDMGLKPSRNHSIDRIDNNGNYEPSNCRWATWEQQNNNKRNKKK